MSKDSNCNNCQVLKLENKALKEKFQEIIKALNKLNKSNPDPEINNPINEENLSKLCAIRNEFVAEIEKL